MIKLPAGKNILDVCCGPQYFYYNKDHPGLVTMDIREVDETIYPDNPKERKKIIVSPDYVADFRNIPFDDESFNLVIFDPPHLKWTSPKSIMGKSYGVLNSATWAMDIQLGFVECMRVLKIDGVLIFKWNDHDISTKELLQAIPYKPIFGNKDHKGRSTTHWLIFMKESKLVGADYE